MRWATCRISSPRSSTCTSAWVRGHLLLLVPGERAQVQAPGWVLWCLPLLHTRLQPANLHVPPPHLPNPPGWHEFAEFTADDVGTVDSGLNSMVR